MIDVIKKWFDRVFSHEEILVLLLLLFGSLFLILKLSNVFTPIIISVVFAFLMQGLIKKMVQYKIPESIAITIAFLIFMSAFLAILFILIPLVWRQLFNLLDDLPGMLNQGQVLLKQFINHYPQFISESMVQEWIVLARAEIGKAGQWLLSYSLSTLPNLFAMIIYIVLIPLLVFFFLKDRRVILAWMGRFLPKERPILTKVWDEMDDQIANYIRGKAIEILIVGGVSYISFVILDLRYAALLGLLVGLSVLIPFIGAAVVTLPVAIVGFYQWGWGWDLCTLMIVYGVIQTLDGNVLVPLLFSETVDLHPVAIILAVLLFGGLWGIWGVFFAIPLATLIKAVLNAWPNLQDPPELASHEISDQ